MLGARANNKGRYLSNYRGHTGKFTGQKMEINQWQDNEWRVAGQQEESGLGYKMASTLLSPSAATAEMPRSKALNPLLTVFSAPASRRLIAVQPCGLSIPVR